MKIAIMQPYFFPYLGYISLIKHTDQFILFDPVQFIRHGWIERNRILKPNEGWQYIQIPLIKHDRETLIRNISIDNTQNWKGKILAQLQHYKKKSPYYFKVIKLLEDIFNHEYHDIVSLNRFALLEVCHYLEVQKEISIFSQMNIDIESVNKADEWALNICRALGNVNEYWNPSGGKSFFDKSKYDNYGIKLFFHSQRLVAYDQNREHFEPGLSIIDVMMFNSTEEINKMLDQYDLS